MNPVRNFDKTGGNKDISNGVKIWVVIPAYNEGFSLGVILNAIRKTGLSVLVIDDGSTDNTYAVAKEKADAAIQNESNLGKGTSLNKAIAYLRENCEFDYIITMDGDGQHSPADLDKFIEAARKGNGFVVGNRMGKPLGMPGLRIVTNKLMSWLISRICGYKIPDTQCGFRLIKREVLESIVIKTSKFEVESELVIKASRAGVRIKSIPIRSIYFAHQPSRIRPLADTVRFIKFISKLSYEPR